MLRRKSAAAVAGVATLLLLSTGNAATAAVRQSPLPGCVSWTLNDRGYTDHLRVYNNCGSGKWLKVILAHKRDYKCTYFAAHTNRWYSWPWPGRFSAIHNC